MGTYTLGGYTPPRGVDSKEKVRKVQATLGVKQDGVWGPKTQAAWVQQGYGDVWKSSAQDYIIKGYFPPLGVSNRKDVGAIQAMHNISQDDIWRPKTQATWEKRNAESISQPHALEKTSVPIARTDYAVSGYRPPAGVSNRQDVRKIQATLGVPQDGVWGPKTQAAWEGTFGNLWALNDARNSTDYSKTTTANNATIIPPRGIEGKVEIAEIQKRLGVKPNGLWGKETQRAWEQMRNAPNESINKSNEKKLAIAAMPSKEPWKKAIENGDGILNSLESIREKLLHDGQATDANNIEKHIALLEAQMGQGNESPSSANGKVEYGVGKYDSVRNRNKKGLFDYGYVKANILEEKKSSVLEKGAVKAMEFLAGWLVPLLSVKDAWDFAGQKLKLKSYFKYNPSVILQPGDISVYYSGKDSGGYGNTYYFRDGELLFVANDGGSLAEAGSAFWKLTDEYSYDAVQPLAGMLESEVYGKLLPGNPVF